MTYRNINQDGAKTAGLCIMIGRCSFDSQHGGSNQHPANVAVLDYKKNYDMVSQSWTLHCLKMYKISNQVEQCIEKTMQTWRVELTAGGKSFADVKIQRRIFQGNALSPLLFVIAMMPVNHILRKCKAVTNSVNHRKKSTTWCTWTTLNEKELENLLQTVRIFSQDTGMEFGFEKCAMLVMKCGKRSLRKGSNNLIK